MRPEGFARYNVYNSILALHLAVNNVRGGHLGVITASLYTIEIVHSVEKH